jgi:hypothetical protein
VSDHRRPRRWVWAEMDPWEVRAGRALAGLADWAGVGLRNLFTGRARRPASVATSAECGICSYPVCVSCRVAGTVKMLHRACGALVDDPPCGCWCVSAALGRRAHHDRGVQAL